jgi:hypothetical protein
VRKKEFQMNPNAPPGPKRRALLAARRLLEHLVGWLLALLILFEEWGWEPLQAVLARLAAWLHLRRLEDVIRRLPPYAALAMFALPTLMLLPIKLGALWLIGKGQVVAGAALILVAKVAGTAIVARLFTLTQPALMRLDWFAALHGRGTRWKTTLLTRVRASGPWRAARVFKRQVRRRWQAFWQAAGRG